MTSDDSNRSPKPSPKMFGRANAPGGPEYKTPQAALREQRDEKAAESRCCKPCPARMSWVDFWDAAHDEVAAVDAWIGSFSPNMRESLEGEIEALRDRAARGGLSPTDPGKPILAVVTQPDLFELRWTLTDPSGDLRHLRQYHGEPGTAPQLLVGVHRHFKWTDGQDAENRARQNASMAYGQKRYETWQQCSDSDK